MSDVDLQQSSKLNMLEKMNTLTVAGDNQLNDICNAMICILKRVAIASLTHLVSIDG